MIKFGEYLKESHMDDFGDSINEIKKGLYEYNKCDNVNLISEAGLSRVLSQIDKKNFAIITAYKDYMDKKQKITANRKLRGNFNSLKMGVYQLVGHWRECDDENIPYEKCPKERLVDVIERSYLVPKSDDMSDDEFEKLILGLGKDYKQDAIVIKKDGIIFVKTPSGQVIDKHTNITLGKIAQSYSQHVKKLNTPFIFEGIEIPSSIGGRMVMKACGIKYPIMENNKT